MGPKRNNKIFRVQIWAIFNSNRLLRGEKLGKIEQRKKRGKTCAPRGTLREAPDPSRASKLLYLEAKVTLFGAKRAPYIF